jgi:hypothetical protein
MQALAGVSFLGLIIVSLVVGTRLLLLARRTRELPELVLGLSLVIVMGLAYPGMVLIDIDLGLSSATQRGVMFGLNALLDLGFLLLFVFTARVFRAGNGAARLMVAVAAATFVVHLWLVGTTLHASADLAAGRAATTIYGLLSLGTAAVGYAWSGCEALAHWRRLLRRRRLGLVDPVLCNRMWLWTMMSFSSLLGALATSVYLVLGIDVLTRPDAMFITAITGLGQGLFLWLTFLPPRAYRSLVLRRASSPLAD